MCVYIYVFFFFFDGAIRDERRKKDLSYSKVPRCSTS